MFRKGTTLIRKLVGDNAGKLKSTVISFVVDIIGDRFWKENPEIIGLKSMATYQPPNQINNVNNTAPSSPGTIGHASNGSSSQIIIVNSNQVK